MNYKFLIYISYNYAIPIGKPLQLEIEKRGDTVKWFTDIEETNKHFTSEEDVLYTIKDVIFYKPDIVLTATDDVPDFITGIKAQIFHGFFAQKRPSANNNFYHFRIRGFFDLYCTQGPTTTSKFKELAQKKKYFDVIETGWSKVDPLFPLDGIENNQTPTILIASTFTPRLSLAHNENLFQEIVRLSSTGRYRFKLVLHPKMNSEIVSKWKSINSPFFTFYDTTDLIPLFKKANILFADNTSAIQEFLLQKKIVVSFKHTFKHNYLMHVDEAKDIEKIFEKALEEPIEIIKNIKTFLLELHPYFDGKSSKRVIDSSISFLHQDKSYLKSKPLNLLRKYKIRKKLNYFTFKTFKKPYTIDNKNHINSTQKGSTSINTVKLSSVIITYNEEEHLEKCLSSLVKVSDEIIVVDSFSTDKTKEICRAFNVTFIEHKFEGYIEQKNFAISMASNDYILSLDGDEAISEELKDSILKVKQNWDCDGYYSNRLNNYCGQWIKHSDWYPDKKLRLFKKESGEWKGINPHDSYTLKKGKKAGKLKGDLLHWIYRDYNEHKQKTENFSTIAAGAYYKLGIKSSLFKIVYRPSWAFFKSYFLRLGFLDGKKGYRICLQTYCVTSLKYKKLYKHWHSK